jgi:hypothetical protein
MIPFENTWPYDIIQGDIYVSECPFCHRANILLPMPPEELDRIREGRKKRLVFPCCHSTMILIDADRDYLLSNQPVRKK